MRILRVFIYFSAALTIAGCAGDAATPQQPEEPNETSDIDVGLFTSLAVDGTGRLHVSYWDATNDDLKYASCAGDCDMVANWQVVTLEANGEVGAFTSLAVDGSDGVHVSYLYTDDTADPADRDDLKYATCAADCTNASNWNAVVVDAPFNVGTHSSLTVDGTGRVHVIYRDAASRDLKYATCATDCTTAANWQAVALDPTPNVGFAGSLSVDGSERLHLSYWDYGNGNLKYGTCAADCTTVANWQLVTVLTLSPPGTMGHYNSLAVDGNGGLHVGYQDFNDFDLDYATCAASCTTAASWQTVSVDVPDQVGQYASVAVDASIRVHMAYRDVTNGDLKYATCAAGCATAGNWQALAVDVLGDVGRYTSLGVDGTGRVHVSYYDVTNSNLKYATCAASCATTGNWQAVTVDTGL
jgi:hypothetical protein